MKNLTLLNLLAASIMVYFLLTFVLAFEVVYYCYDFKGIDLYP